MFTSQTIWSFQLWLLIIITFVISLNYRYELSGVNPKWKMLRFKKINTPWMKHVWLKYFFTDIALIFVLCTTAIIEKVNLAWISKSALKSYNKSPENNSPKDFMTFSSPFSCCSLSHSLYLCLLVDLSILQVYSYASLNSFYFFLPILRSKIYLMKDVLFSLWHFQMISWFVELVMSVWICWNETIY